MADSKEYILEHLVTDFEEIEINGLYLIPTDDEYDDDGYMCMHVIGYARNPDEEYRKIYYDLNDNHDVVDLRNFGLSGISMDVEKENGLIRIFWSDRQKKKINKWNANLSIFALYGEEII